MGRFQPQRIVRHAVRAVLWHDHVPREVFFYLKKHDKGIAGVVSLTMNFKVFASSRVLYANIVLSMA